MNMFVYLEFLVTSRMCNYNLSVSITNCPYLLELPLVQALVFAVFTRGRKLKKRSREYFNKTATNVPSPPPLLSNRTFSYTKRLERILKPKRKSFCSVTFFCPIAACITRETVVRKIIVNYSTSIFSIRQYRKPMATFLYKYMGESNVNGYRCCDDVRVR